MKDANVDAIIVADANNVAYAAGYRSEKIIRGLYDAPAVCIVARGEWIEPILIAGITDLAYLVESPSWVSNMRIYDLLGYSKIADLMDERVTDELRLNEGQLAVKRLRERLRHTLSSGIVDGVVAAVTEMGLEQAVLACDDAFLASLLGEQLPNATFHSDGMAVLRQIRIVKTNEELELLRQGARINEQGVRAAIGATHPGTVWQEVINAYKLELTQAGGVWAGDTGLMFGAGRRSSGVYEDTSYRVAKGDLVVFDAQGYYRSYAFDVGRTGTVGPPSQRQIAHFNAVRDGLLAAESVAHSGVSTTILEAAVLAAMEEHDIELPGLTLVRIHSLGYDVAEVPYSMYVKSLQSFILETNMVVNIDVFHYAVGEGGYHLERSLCITDDLPEHLYAMPLDLIEIA